MDKDLATTVTGFIVSGLIALHVFTQANLTMETTLVGSLVAVAVAFWGYWTNKT